jgi:phospholipase/carboxylesterase
MPLSGPSLPPASGRASHLVVLLHGYGADGNDLIGLAQHWQALLPGCAFAAPNAPSRLPGGAGFQWFPISRIDPHEMRAGVENAAPGLESFVAGELTRLGLGDARLILAGFSQGTMLALHLGLRRKTPPAAIVGFSGMLTAAPPAGAAIPPILLSHGDADTVIPPQAMLAAAGELARAGARVQWHLAAGIGHGIDETTLAIAGRFLALAVQGSLQSDEPV